MEVCTEARTPCGCPDIKGCIGVASELPELLVASCGGLEEPPVPIVGRPIRKYVEPFAFSLLRHLPGGSACVSSLIWKIEQKQLSIREHCFVDLVALASQPHAPNMRHHRPVQVGVLLTDAVALRRSAFCLRVSQEVSRQFSDSDRSVHLALMVYYEHALCNSGTSSYA